MVLLSQPPLISTTTPSQFLLPNPPPHSSTYASRTGRRFAVVCNAENHKDNNNNSNNKTGGDEISSTKAKPIDRRNVLLGLGGLYGTTNLLSTNFSPALATPISAPDLVKCSRGTDLNTTKPLDFNCCPPVLSDQIIDYKLPPISTMRLRPAAHLVDKNYVAKYEKAVELMKALPENDPRSFMQQASVHCAYCNLTYDQKGDPSKKLQIHNSWLFFPWHRWYLYFYERILGMLIDDPTFGLPFWNWDNPPGMVVPGYFKRQGSPLFNERRNPDNMNATVDVAYSSNSTTASRDTIIKNNLAVMYNEMVSNAGCPEDFYGAKYVTGSDANPGPGSVERGSHTALHVWVGESKSPSYDMGNFSTAGREPLFFSHHANVDRLWSIRRALAAKESKPQQFNDSELLDANFVFYDENAQLVRVKVGDAMVHERMGYAIQDVEIPWLEKRPIARVKKSKVAAKSNNVPKATGTGVFPVTLDKVFKVLVDRPKRSRSKKEKEKEQELLVIKGIRELDTSRFVRFDVFVNDEDDKPDEFDKAEYAGCYSQMPHNSPEEPEPATIRLTLTNLLEDLDVDDDDQILVSLVPKAGGKFLTIDGINIIYDTC